MYRKREKNKWTRDKQSRWNLFSCLNCVGNIRGITTVSDDIRKGFLLYSFKPDDNHTF